MHPKGTKTQDERLTGRDILLNNYFTADKEKKKLPKDVDPTVARWAKNFDLKPRSSKEIKNLRKHGKLDDIFGLEEEICQQYFTCAKSAAEVMPEERRIRTVTYLLPYYIRLIPRLQANLRRQLDNFFEAKTPPGDLLQSSRIPDIVSLFFLPGLDEKTCPDRLIVLRDFLDFVMASMPKIRTRPELNQFVDMFAEIGTTMINSVNELKCEDRFWPLRFVMSLLVSVSVNVPPSYKKLRDEFLSQVVKDKVDIASCDNQTYSQFCLFFAAMFKAPSEDDYDWIACVHMCMVSVSKLFPVRNDGLLEPPNALDILVSGILYATEKLITMNLKTPYEILEVPSSDDCQDCDCALPSEDEIDVMVETSQVEYKRLVDVYQHIQSFKELLKDDAFTVYVTRGMKTLLKSTDHPLLRGFIVVCFRQFEPEKACKLLTDGDLISKLFADKYIPFIYFNTKDSGWAQRDAIFSFFLLLRHVGGKIAHEDRKKFVTGFLTCIRLQNLWILASLFWLVNWLRKARLWDFLSEILEHLVITFGEMVNWRKKSSVFKFAVDQLLKSLVAYFEYRNSRGLYPEKDGMDCILSSIVNATRRSQFLPIFNDVLNKCESVEFLFGQIGSFVSNLSKQKGISQKSDIDAVCAILKSVECCLAGENGKRLSNAIHDVQFLDSLGHFGKSVVAFAAGRSYREITEQFSTDFDEEQKNMICDVAMIVISVLLQASCMSDKVDKLLLHQSCRAVTDLVLFLRFVRYEKDLIYLLFSLALRQRVSADVISLDSSDSSREKLSDLQILSAAGIHLLNAYSFTTNTYGMIAGILYKLAKWSLSNCYMCSIGQTIRYLLKYLVTCDENNDDIQKLFLTIGTSFFGIRETVMALRTIIETSDDKSHKLTQRLEIILKHTGGATMESSRPSWSSFFHVWPSVDEQRPRFFVGNLELPLKVSFQLQLEAKECEMKLADEIWNKTILISLEKEYGIALTLRFEGNRQRFQLEEQSSEWISFCAELTNEKVTVMGCGFDVNGMEAVSLEISGGFCNFGEVSIQSKGTEKLFSPLLCDGCECPDINSEDKATFRGLIVPYCPSLLQSIRSCGIKIFVPWFRNVAPRSDTQFLLMIQLMELLIGRDDGTLIQRHFFRALSHLLAELPEEISSNQASGKAILSVIDKLMKVHRTRSRSDTDDDEMNLKQASLYDEIERYIVHDGAILLRFIGSDEYVKLVKKTERGLELRDFLAQRAFGDFQLMMDVVRQNKEPKYLSEPDQMYLIAMLKKDCDALSYDTFQKCKNIEESIFHVCDPEYFSCHFPFSSFFAKDKPEWTLMALKFVRLTLEHGCKDSGNLSHGLYHAVEHVKTVNAEIITALQDTVFDSSRYRRAGSSSLALPYQCLVYLLFHCISIYDSRQSALDDLFGVMSGYDASVILKWTFHILYLAALDEKGINRWISLFGRCAAERDDPRRELINIYFAVALSSMLLKFDGTNIVITLLTSALDLVNTRKGSEIWTFIFEVLLSVIPNGGEFEKPVDFLDYLDKSIAILTSSEKDKTAFSSYVRCKSRNVWPYGDFFELVLDRLRSLEYSPLSDVPLNGILFGIILCDTTGSHQLRNEFVSSLESIEPNPGLTTPILLCLEHFREDSIVDYLRKCSPEFAEKSSLCIRMEHRSGEFPSHIDSEYERARKMFTQWKGEAIEVIRRETQWDQIKELQNRSNIEDEQMTEAIHTLKACEERFLVRRRVNQQICDEITNEFQTDTASDGNQIWHKKIARVTDRIGRHLVTSRNRHFNNHADAERGAACSASPKMSISQKLHVIDENDSESNDESFTCDMITPTSIYRGRISIGQKFSIFHATEADYWIADLKVKANKVCRIFSPTITYILWRRYRHKDTALEIFTNTGESYFFDFFDSSSSRKDVLRLFKEVNSREKLNMQIQNCPPKEYFHSMKFTKQWINGKISNYEYLYWVNIFAGRSFRDLTQYPVYPWVLNDYTSNDLDLNDEDKFRDLSKPIGALNKARLQELKQARMELDGSPEQCLYRVHYSTPTYVIMYLLRCEPFTTLHINLQNGYFDVPSRLFSSIPAAWQSVSSEAMDLRELIPEFFSFPDFLINYEHYPLGTLSSGESVNDVELPPWAKNAASFIVCNRLALESPYVSKNLHSWIDLIFGEKAYEKRVHADNDFHPYCYWQSMNKENENTVQCHAIDFGIVPTQLFSDSHPKRKACGMSWKDASIGLIEVAQGHEFKNPLFVTWEQDDVVVFRLPLSYCRVRCGDKKNSVQVDKEKKISTILKESTHAKILRRHFFYLPERRIVVVAVPWRNTFQCVWLDKSSKSDTLEAVELHGCVTALAIGEGPELVVAIVTQDAVITIIREDGRPNRIFGHSRSIIDVSLSQEMDLAASIDSQYLLLHLLSTGNMVTMQHLHQSDLRTTPNRVLLAQLGLVIVVYETGSDGTLIQVMDLGGRCVSEKLYSEKCHFVDLARFEDESEFLLIYLDDKLMVLRVYDLDQRENFKFDSPVIMASYNNQKKRIAAILENGTFCMLEVKNNNV